MSHPLDIRACVGIENGLLLSQLTNVRNSSFFYFPKTTSEVSDLPGIINYATLCQLCPKSQIAAIIN